MLFRSKIFRAGIWKPRTKPGGFEGIGVDGLAWLKRVKQETGKNTARGLVWAVLCVRLAVHY